MLTRDTLIVGGRKKAPSLLPVVIQRQQVDDALAKYLNMLGIHRISRRITVLDRLSDHDGDGNTSNAISKPEHRSET